MNKYVNRLNKKIYSYYNETDHNHFFFIPHTNICRKLETNNVILWQDYCIKNKKNFAGHPFEYLTDGNLLCLTS